MVGQTILHYKILEKLGGGGMGVVYKAEDLKLDRIVALKFLPPELTRDEEAKNRFVHEAKAASSLDHNNICAVHEIDETDDGQIFICMNYYDGDTLKKKIAKGPLKLDEAIDITLQIAAGLQKAHEKGIIHRDIKPANIFITNDGIVKILDFGLAKLSGYSVLTKIGETLGTPAYMSPEQTRGELVDNRTDIWSLGAVLYEMITGQLPFKGDYDQAIIYSIIHEQPEAPTSLRSGVPMELERIINKVLSKNPAGRYQSINDMIVDLIELKNNSYSPTISQPSNRKSLSKVTFRKWYIIMAVISFALIIIAVYLYLYEISANKNETPSIREMIVVLPFKNLGQQDDDYFAEGITDEITSKLSYIGNLGVISKNSAEKLAKSNKSTEEIGKELGVGYILSGTIRWAKGSGNDSRVRITPLLTRVSDNTITWSDSYDKVLDDIFKVQNDIAQQVVDKLGGSFIRNQTQNIPPTNNLTAYDFYLKGLFYYQRGGYAKPDLQTSISLFNKAIELDPQFALAYAYLSIAKSEMYWFYYDRSSKNEKEAFDDAQKSYKLNPNLAEVHLAFGFYYYWYKLNYEKAIEEFSQALKAQSNNSEAYLGIGAVYRRMGKFDLTIQNLLKGISFDPLSIECTRNLAETYHILRDYRNADRYYNRVAELNPELSFLKVYLAQNYIDWKGDTEIAKQIVNQIKDDKFPGVTLNFLVYLDLLNRNYENAIKKLNIMNIEYEATQFRFTPRHQLLGLIYKFKNEQDLSKAYLDSSKTSLEKLLEDYPRDERFYSSLGITYAALGLKEKAIAEGKKAIGILPIDREAYKGYYRNWDLAIIYVLVGDYYNALKQIDFILSIPGTFSINQLKLDPLFDSLRDIQDYKIILSKYSMIQ